MLVLERETFPREKVCGDCLNPACWPILRRLGIADTIRTLPHGVLNAVEFIGVNGPRISVPLPRDEDAEIAVKRSFFDHALMQRARECGADVRQAVTVMGAQWLSDLWQITTGDEEFRARVLVAADGRNSSVARFCGLLPRIEKERVAIQTHLPLPHGFGDRVVLEFRPEGYSGQAPIGEDQLNLCLVSTAAKLAGIRRWAEARFGISPWQSWRTITPLRRDPIYSVTPNLFLVGDAARVVEPLTGEGIYYAIASGELAASFIRLALRRDDTIAAGVEYQKAHARLYRGRLWVNRLARQAVLHPRIASGALELCRARPGLLRFLTRKIVR